MKCKRCEKEFDTSFYDMKRYAYKIKKDYFCSYGCYSKSFDEEYKDYNIVSAEPFKSRDLRNKKGTRN